MDIFDEEILKVWQSFYKHELRYILIGGFAVNLHGYQRFTGDMDILLEDTLENRRKLRASFSNLGMGDIPLLETIKFIPGWTDFPMNNGLRLDILTDLKGINNFTFEECYRISSLAEIENVPVRFLHINHLIENKEIVNRDKDKLDVQQLKKIRKFRGEN